MTYVNSLLEPRKLDLKRDVPANITTTATGQGVSWLMSCRLKACQYSPHAAHFEKLYTSRL